MKSYPIFLSVVLVGKNQSLFLEKTLEKLVSYLQSLVSDFEIVVVDNGSQDDSVSLLKKLTGIDALPNIQVYALTKEVDSDAATWVGIENALGDYVVVFDPTVDDMQFISTMLEKAVSGLDVVFARNTYDKNQSLGYRLVFSVFNYLYKKFNGLDIKQDAPAYRVLSKKVINFILQHAQPEIVYRHLPATAGFSKTYLDYVSKPLNVKKKHLRESVDRGVQLLVSTTKAPMRLVNVLCVFGALGSLSYSVYVIFVALYGSNVAPGWASLSLQVSLMFMLTSLVLLILSEYILQMASFSNQGPTCHIAQEFTSARLTREEKLNVEFVEEK